MNKLACILLFLIISVSCKDLITYASFLINQDFIANTLCINRDKPVMRCNGKCHLSKLIKENQEEQNDSPNNTVKEKEATVVFLPEICQSLIFNINKTERRQPVFFYKNIFSSSYLKEVFHPPQFV